MTDLFSSKKKPTEILKRKHYSRKYYSVSNDKNKEKHEKIRENKFRFYSEWVFSPFRFCWKNSSRFIFILFHTFNIQLFFQKSITKGGIHGKKVCCI